MHLKDSSGKKTNLLDFLKDNEIAEDSFSISKHQDSAGNWHYEYTTSSIHKGFDAEIKKADNTAASKTASLEQLKTKKTEIDNTLQSLDARKDEKTAAIEGKKEKIEEKINERNSHEEGSSAYIRISNEIANLEAEKGQLKMEEAAIEQEITTAEDNKRMTDQQIDATQTEIDEASQRSTALKDMQGKMLKELTAYAITTVLNSPDDASIDGLLKNQVQTALATMKESTREEDTVNAMREELLKVNPNDTKLFEKYMTGEIKTFKEFDDIQTALNNIAAKRNDENIELQGSKGRLESSSLFAAQQADKNSSNSGK